MSRLTIDLIRVYPSRLHRSRGRLVAGALSLPCALGRSGTTRTKREGDGKTPVGCFALLQAFYRADRRPRPRTRLPVRPIRHQDGWCDDPADRCYNRPVALPYKARHETLWRDDGRYDIVVDIAWNRGPIVRGRGSAIFLHLAGPGLKPTAGCIAVEPHVMARLLARIGPGTRIAILG